MHIETGKILELRRKLDEEMNRISEDFISSNHLETESYLNVIKYLKNDYQDAIEDMVDMYREVLEKPEVLDEWTQEVKDIANIVKKHVNVYFDYLLAVKNAPNVAILAGSILNQLRSKRNRRL